MTDVVGHEHLFVEKVPVVSEVDLDDTSDFPQTGYIGCIVVERKKREGGRQIVRIDTEGIETTAGKTNFKVFFEQLSKFPRE